MIRFLRKCMEEGVALEIDGLGTLKRASDGNLVLTPFTQPKVFLAYVEEDLPQARKIFAALKEEGCDPWLDKEKLLPGQNWPRRIEAAISVADFFVPLFSRHSICKRGQFQAELRYALDCVKQRPIDNNFFVPLRLEECCVPSRITDSIQYVDMFPDWELGMERLVKTVTAR
ncbi:MAG: toll/interleukin-1 receptor domain-containing protein [Bryobacterales bacterium]|nr:toll/interleukin-1 receptor domain-containing protein [Bryobacterales bacterium]